MRTASTNLTRSLVAALALGAAASGCGDELQPMGVDAGPAVDGGSVTSTDGAVPSDDIFHHTVTDGVYETWLDATSMVEWYHLDLETGRAVTENIATDTTWDLAIQRFKLLTNGGVSGPGSVGVARVMSSFDALEVAPADGYIADVADGDDRDDTDDSAFTNGTDDWYSYDLNTHTLTPRADLTYVVRTTEGGYFKVQILGYYDEAGTPGFLRFRWTRVTAPVGVDGGTTTLADAGSELDAAVDADGGVVAGDAAIEADAAPSIDAAVAPDAWVDPVPSGALTWTAASSSAPIYIDLETASVITPANPATDTVWDLAIARTRFQMHSGTTADGIAAARVVTGATRSASVTETGTLGFSIDELVSTGMPGVPASSMNPVLANWYDYDATTHVVTPKDAVFALRSNQGAYFALRIYSWNDGVYRVTIAPLTVRPETVELEVDASVSGTFVYLDLESATPLTPITVADPATDGRWDLALSRVSYRTNSGTSGAGEGGAANLMTSSFAAVTSIGAATFTSDAIFTDPRPGSTPTTGNAVLNAWYDYDGATMAVTPRDTVFAVRLADGSFGKLEIVSYTSGRTTFRYSYAGPGRTTF